MWRNYGLCDQRVEYCVVMWLVGSLRSLRTRKSAVMSAAIMNDGSIRDVELPPRAPNIY